MPRLDDDLGLRVHGSKGGWEGFASGRNCRGEKVVRRGEKKMQAEEKLDLT